MHYWYALCYSFGSSLECHGVCSGPRWRLMAVPACRLLHQCHQYAALQAGGHHLSHLRRHLFLLFCILVDHCCVSPLPPTPISDTDFELSKDSAAFPVAHVTQLGRGLQAGRLIQQYIGMPSVCIKKSRISSSTSVRSSPIDMCSPCCRMCLPCHPAERTGQGQTSSMSLQCMVCM